MKMKMKKIDLSGVKDYLFDKGERVGLIVFGAIAVLLVGLGIIKAVSAGTTYADQFKKKHAEISQQLRPAAPLPPIEFTKPAYPWPDRGVTLKDPAQLMPLGDAPDKPQNPEILAVMSDPDHMFIDVLKGGYLCLEHDKNGNPLTQNGDQNKLAKIMKPARMVVVTAVFPMKDQFEQHRRALAVYYPTLPDLIKVKDDQPKPLGLEVFRREIKPEAKTDKNDKKDQDKDEKTDKEIEWEPLYVYNEKTDTVDVAERLQKMYREALIDPDNQKMLGNYLQRGLVAPLPWMANVQYAKPMLKGVKLEPYVPTPITQPTTSTQPGTASNLPGGGRTIAAETKWVPVALASMTDTKLADKLKGKFDYFDASGDQTPPDPTATVRTGPRIRAPRGPGFSGSPPPGTPNPNEVVDKIVRFVDVGVEPGKTYQYAFRVRIANPNFGKNDEVAFKELAEIKELLSPNSFTPEITIPEEYFVYATDLYAQGLKVSYPIRDGGVDRGSDTKDSRSDSSIAYGLWTTPIQVHRWLATLKDQAGDEVVADWAIAERLLVRRGDILGRRGVMAEVPVWSKTKENFTIGFQVQKVAAVKAKQAAQPRADSGLPIDFVKAMLPPGHEATPLAKGLPPPLLVDFEGGFKKAKLGLTEVRDECTVKMLVLASDGSLLVRDSRSDTDGDNPVAIERNKRWEEWLERIQKLRHGPGTTGGFGMPKVP